MFLYALLGVLLLTVALSIKFLQRYRRDNPRLSSGKSFGFVQYGFRVFILKKSVICNTGVESDGFYIEYMPLNIFAWAPTKEAALVLFCFYFNTTYLLIVLAHNLSHPHERLIKNRFWQIVKEVREGDVAIPDFTGN